MVKKFNETGVCFPEDHFMGDISQKLAVTYQMVEDGAYFIINRPRQYGKTTMLFTVADKLIQSGEYVVFNISFEGIGSAIFEEEQVFSQGFVDILSDYAYESAPELEDWMKSKVKEVNSLKDLSAFISELADRTPKRIVLLIDEVDKSSNNQLFINFLAMMRDKYLNRKRRKTFHSVVLAGVHDVRSLKLKIRPESDSKYNSPWNVATTFEVDMNLSVDEIKVMLEDYVQVRGVKMDTQWVAERLFYFTSGYPYLVSKLCKLIDEKALPKKNVKEWTEDDLDQAFQLILHEPNNANFDTLMKNLEDYPELYDLVFSLIFDSQPKTFSSDNPTINLGVLHGIFAQSERGHLMIQNRVYRERIANMMVSKWRTSYSANYRPVLESSQYLLPNNGLNMEKVITNFQIFMRENHSDKDSKFLEREGRLIFLAFLKPILNGAGFDFKEPQISDERRIDVVITYNTFKYIAELKIWYGEEAHQKGLTQLTDYLDRQNLDTGYLVIFDHSKKKSWKKDWLERDGKRIFWARV